MIELTLGHCQNKKAKGDFPRFLSRKRIFESCSGTDRSKILKWCSFGCLIENVALKCSGFGAVMFSLREIPRRQRSIPRTKFFGVHMWFIWRKTEEAKIKKTLACDVFVKVSKTLLFKIFGPSISNCGTPTFLFQKQKASKTARECFWTLATVKSKSTIHSTNQNIKTDVLCSVCERYPFPTSSIMVQKYHRVALKELRIEMRIVSTKKKEYTGVLIARLDFGGRFFGPRLDALGFSGSSNSIWRGGGSWPPGSPLKCATAQFCTIHSIRKWSVKRAVVCGNGAAPFSRRLSSVGFFSWRAVHSPTSSPFGLGQILCPTNFPKISEEIQILHAFCSMHSLSFQNLTQFCFRKIRFESDRL